MIQALIPLGLRAVEEALVAEVQALAGPRYSRNDEKPGVVRWGAQRGSIYLADQKLEISVPRVRDRREAIEVPLATYALLQNRRGGCTAGAAGCCAFQACAITPGGCPCCRRLMVFAEYDLTTFLGKRTRNEL
jgi:hypothetical protein